MLADKAMRVSRRIELRRPKNEDVTLEARVIDCFPAIALFIFVSYHGLRDFIASTIGMYGAVVYTLTGISYLLLIVYWFRCGLRLSGRVILPAVAVFAIFSIYMVLCDVDYFIFDDYALPQAINPMGGMIAFLFLASQNDAKRADAALKFACIVMTLYLQASLSSVMQATTLYGYDMGLGFEAMFFALLSSLHRRRCRRTQYPLLCPLARVCAFEHCAYPFVRLPWTPSRHYRFCRSQVPGLCFRFKDIRP